MMPESVGGETVADELLAQLRRLTRATVALWVVVVLAIVGVFLYAFNARRESARTTAALCVLRADLRTRVAQSDAFLRTHPHGFAGIPAATLRQSTDGQRRTIEALQSLRCPAVVPPAARTPAPRR